MRAVVAPSPERDLHRVAEVGLGAALAHDGAGFLDELPRRPGDGDARAAGVGLHEQRGLAPARGRAHRPAGLDPPVDLRAVGKDVERGDLGVDAELHHPRLVAAHERREREHRHDLGLARGAVDQEALVERPLREGLGEHCLGDVDVVHVTSTRRWRLERRPSRGVSTDDQGRMSDSMSKAAGSPPSIHIEPVLGVLARRPFVGQHEEAAGR